MLAGCVRLSLVSAYMRLVFMMDPGARCRDLEAVTESYNLPEEGLKYIQWRNERTVARFFYTWNMIKDHFKTQMQDINKVVMARDIISPLPFSATVSLFLALVTGLVGRN